MKKLLLEKQGGRNVQKKRQGDLLVIRFADGENLIKEMDKALTDEGIASAIVIGGVGMVKNTALSFYKGRGEYETVPVAEETELCSLSGNVSTLDGELVIHLHAVLGRPGGEALGGHFSSGDVNMTAEVAILATPHQLIRRSDPKTGLRTLVFEEGRGTEV